MLTLLFLGAAVLCDESEKLVGERDAAAARPRLHVDLDQAAAASLGAPPGVALAVGRARRWARPLVALAVLRARHGLVLAGAAGVRVGAAVLPGAPLQR